MTKQLTTGKAIRFTKRFTSGNDFGGNGHCKPFSVPKGTTAIVTTRNSDFLAVKFAKRFRPLADWGNELQVWAEEQPAFRKHIEVL